jgi:Ala-tRNA(Pro) deacylase
MDQMASRGVGSTLVPNEVLDRIHTLLRAAEVEFREIEHEPTHTSAESARARGEELRIGGKALLLKVEDTFHLFVLSAALKLDSAAVKRYFSVKRQRFATSEELSALGLVPGAVPPFGKPVLPFDLYVDRSIVANPRIAFNAGSLTTSIIMSVPDYLRIAQPTVFDFSQ